MNIQKEQQLQLLHHKLNMIKDLIKDLTFDQDNQISRIILKSAISELEIKLEQTEQAKFLVRDTLPNDQEIVRATQ